MVRKAPYLMGKSMVSGFDFPLNQSIDIWILWMVAKSCTTWDGRKPIMGCLLSANWCRISQPSTVCYDDTITGWWFGT